MAKKYIDAELIKSTRALYFDIDACITELIRARTEQNEENEGKALFRMEGLMVATMQQLDCIIDSLQQEPSCDTCTNDKGCVTCKDGELWEGKEQPCENLTTEIEKYFQGLWPGMETAEQCNTDMHFTPPAIMRLANHFYELAEKDILSIIQSRLEEIPGDAQPRPILRAELQEIINKIKNGDN